MLENVAERDTLIAYETNITDISKVYTILERFQLKFESIGNRYCAFRKYDNTPLLIVCWTKPGNYSLADIDQEIKLENLNIKYNFRIQIVKNNEIINVSDSYGTFINFVFPEILDFTSNDSLIIEYMMEHPKDMNGITLNKNASDLECENKGEIKRCVVPKSHFEGKESGYYYTMHQNHLNTKSISYEITPIKVILNKKEEILNSNKTNSNKLIIVLSIIGGIVIIALIIILLMCCRKRASSSDIDVDRDSETKNMGLVD